MDQFAVLDFTAGVKSDSVRQLLAQAGALTKEDLPYQWVLPTSYVSESLARELESRGIAYDLLFEVRPGIDEPIDRIAGFPWLSSFDEHPFSDDLVMAKLEGTRSLVCSEAFLERMGDMRAGLVLHELDENEGFYAVEPPELPDPVVIPRALHLVEEDGLWIVRSDGRELLTARNGTILRKAGIARAPQCSIEGRTYDWKRVPILSGRVLSVVDEGAVIGVAGAPAYLNWVDEA
ncbi:hypothetical protein ACUN22_30375 [Streptomyces anulatus]|uniref:hypothetical protein n=1 Tax=Streptomyces anulatus TaxID=1892 RepID=UPI00403E232B